MSVVIFVRMMPEPFFSYQYKFFFYDESALNMGDLAEKTIYIYIYIPLAYLMCILLLQFSESSNTGTA